MSRLLHLMVMSAVILQSEAQQRGSCSPTGTDQEGPYYKRNSPLQQSGRGLPLPSLCANSDINDRLFLNGTIRRISATNPCGTPVRALIDIWSANADGAYSDISPSSPDFSCRTRFMTDASGFFAFSSVFPGRYGADFQGVAGSAQPGQQSMFGSNRGPGTSPVGSYRQKRQTSTTPALRPAHVHFKITPLDSTGARMTGNTFTTQAYFALDKYLYPNDQCEDECNSGDPSLIIRTAHDTDIKAFSGTWNVLLPQ